MSGTPGRAAAWGAAAAAGFLFCLPVVTHTSLPYGSDLGFASHSGLGFVQALAEGVLYPRWVDNTNMGFGGPTFIFYCPLAYYLLGAAHALTGDLISAFRLALVIVSVLTALSFFAAARPLTSRWGAVLGAAVYTLAPYHALDLYDRFAYAELASFIWFPPLFLFTRRLLAGRSPGAWLGLTLCYAGLLFTHLVTAYMVLFVLAPYGLLHAARGRRWGRLLPAAGAGAAALLLAAVFLIPMLAQRDEVHMEWVVDAPYGDWRRNFVYRDEVAHGYTPANIKPWVNRAATTQGGLALAAILVLAARGAWRRRGGGGELATDEAAWEAAAHAGLAAWTFFLQIPPSAWIWRLVPELPTVQFPWRFSLFQALAAAFLAACAVAPVAGGSAPVSRLPRWAAAPLAALRGGRGPALAALLIGVAAVPSLLLTARIATKPDRPYMFNADALGDARVRHRVMDEYLPRDMEGWRAFAAAPVTLGVPARFSGPGTVQVEAWTTHRRELLLETPVDDRLLVRTFHHPGWKAWLDGEPVPIDADNPLHAISVAVPAGRHELRLAFGATPDRRLGATISLAALATILASAAALRLRRRQVG